MEVTDASKRARMKKKKKKRGEKKKKEMDSWSPTPMKKLAPHRNTGASMPFYASVTHKAHCLTFLWLSLSRTTGH